MDKLKDKALIGLIGIVVVLILLTVKQCEKEPKTRTIVKKEIIYKTDTITSVAISEPKKVYIYRKDTIKVNDTVYKMTPIVANEYDTTLKSDSATANLQIRTTGQLLSVKGNITYPKEIKAVETIKTRSKSGLFIYGKTNINNFTNIEVGGLYQFKNTIGVIVGAEYETTNNINIKAGVIFKIF